MSDFKKTDKEKAFENLIKELKPITKKSKWLDFGTSSKAKGSTNLTLEFNYNGFDCKVELK